MTDAENLCLALSFLWLGVAICFVMKWFRYFVSADVGMALILLCFTVLAIRHNVPSPQFVRTANAASEAPSTPLVIQAGDDFYHTPDCERLIGRDTIPYDPWRSPRQPCIDCILPNVNRRAAAWENLSPTASTKLPPRAAQAGR